MPDRKYLFGYEYQHYCFLCPGVRKKRIELNIREGQCKRRQKTFPVTCAECFLLKAVG